MDSQANGQGGSSSGHELPVPYHQQQQQNLALLKRPWQVCCNSHYEYIIERSVYYFENWERDGYKQFFSTFLRVF